MLTRVAEYVIRIRACAVCSEHIAAGTCRGPCGIAKCTRVGARRGIKDLVVATYRPVSYVYSRQPFQYGYKMNWKR